MVKFFIKIFYRYKPILSDTRAEIYDIRLLAEGHRAGIFYFVWGSLGVFGVKMVL